MARFSRLTATQKEKLNRLEAKRSAMNEARESYPTEAHLAVTYADRDYAERTARAVSDIPLPKGLEGEELAASIERTAKHRDDILNSATVQKKALARAVTETEGVKLDVLRTAIKLVREM